MMEREKALNLVEKYVKNKNSVKHMLATEAVMKKMADHFGEDPQLWGLAGLLHDIDMERVDYEKKPDKHGPGSVDILNKEGLESEELFDAILAHNPAAGKDTGKLIEKVIRAVDPVTGLIVAATLISPDKKINRIDTDFVMRRFDESSFARGADRELIRGCQDFNMKLEEFISISLKAMQEISDDLGL